MQPSHICVVLKFLSSIVLVAQIVNSNPTEDDQISCLQHDHMICDIDRCIPMTKKCDAQFDCEDFTDERDCDVHLCEPPTWIRCKNGRCVNLFFVCDGEDDCGDRTDEQDCSFGNNSTPIETKSDCSSNEWQCSDKLCIPIQWVCDGKSDCPDGSDETMGCHQEIPCAEFRCNNGQCVSNKWRCDGNKDCSDGSDETNCETTIKPENCTLENNLYLCKDKRTCIKISEFCDRKVHCANNSDEPVSCAQYCGSHNCSHGCITLASNETKCWCPDGYGMEDGHTCVDINECKTYGICDQKCYNTEGSHKCYCDRNYVLQKDGRTCKAKTGEGLLVFSSKSEIRGYYLSSDLYYPIAKGLKQAVGVAYDGRYIYWTEIFSGRESIVRSSTDGMHQEIVVSVGLGSPEDLSVDWITGNIYFTDPEMQHIGVCTNSGLHCTVLISHSIHRPRSIELNPLDGEIFWSDWGRRPEIARSKMDGTEDISFVSNNIHWPNGLALDRPNYRIYWTDAKLTTLESIDLDGHNRRIIFEGIMQHPFGLAVFEDRLYWSDMSSRSVESCDKFTGQNHHVLLKEKKNPIYGLHVYHSVLQVQKSNPCKLAFCSDICLLSGAFDYSCACPLDKVLGVDKHTCRSNAKNQTLLFGTENELFTMQFQLLGNNNVTRLPIPAYNITAITYDGLNRCVFISDASSNSIITMNLVSGKVETLLNDADLGHVTAMDFDNLGNNLYWCDSKRAVVEVLNLNTMSRKVLLKDMMGEIPFAIAVIPNEGYMFVGFQTTARTAHIDRFRMDGTDRIHVQDHGLLGPLYLVYDAETHRILWADAGTGNIETTSIDGDDRHIIKSLRTSPVGIATLNKNVAWINRKSPDIFWANKLNAEGSSTSRNQTIDVSGNKELMHLISFTPTVTQHSHPCQFQNGNCSHLCLVFTGDTAVCACPMGFKLRNDSRTCFKSEHCELNEFHCNRSNLCIYQTAKCDGHKDCIFGEDEDQCENLNTCGIDKFQCRNGECIDKNLICDLHYDCKDKSDEENCDRAIGCLEDQFMCADGGCVDKRHVCDGQNTCSDGSDESNCGNSTCNSEQFRCYSGSCIPRLWECDQEIDCTDGSDEHDQCSYATCKSPKFLCNNELCIEGSLKCNGVDDCGDSSDELSCFSDESSTDCLPHEFRCYQNPAPMCLPKKVRCNGTSECPQHEDEQGCTNCQLDEFECNNKKCIPTMWLCDRTNDCGDGSDEHVQLCLHERSADSQQHRNVYSDCQNRYHCKNGKCIDTHLVCDELDDCGDGSDEGGACSMSCLADNNPCAQICVKTPSGPRCVCNSGYKLNGDGHTCADIKECLLDPPVCSQICHEKPGYFTCSCYEGYSLRPDGKSCKSKNESMSLIFYASDKIFHLSQTSKTLTVLYTEKGNAKVTGIDAQVKERRVYITREEPASLCWIDMDKKKGRKECMRVGGEPVMPTVDWISGNVYYVNNAPHDISINVCSFKLEHCTVIATIDDNKGQISALTLDATNEYLFYAVSDATLFNSPRAIIYKCNLDGSDTKEVIKSTANYVTGLTYDPYKKILYYANLHFQKVFKVNYNETNGIPIIDKVPNPSVLTIFENELYFHTSASYLTICPLYHNYQDCRDVKVHARFGNDFVIFQSSLQLIGPDVCGGSDCKSLCVRDRNGPQCLCNSEQINYKPNQCERKKVVRTVNRNDDGDDSSGETSPGSAIAFVITSIVVLLLAGVIYYVIRKKRTTGNLNISIRFRNQSYRLMRNNDTDNENESQEVVIEPGQHEYYNPMEFPEPKTSQLTSGESKERLF